MVVYVKNKDLTLGDIGSVQGVVPIEKFTKESKIKSKVPVVPQFVADWYEQHRYKLEYSIWQYIYCWDVQKRKSDFHDFMDDDNLKPIETLIKMKDGYEVEKEPLYYYVHFLAGTGGYLNMRYDGLIYISGKDQTDEYKTQFTEAEIKAMDKGDAYWLLREPVEVDGKENE
ncbi:DUF1642 domain-containing protein [Listeria monocytogenes]|nr:DUF1642 domain-containing protein [Listeria monocytogenes]